ncbi:MAG: TonB family protein [Victivallales bacterium]|nr:TonB family protein [Victivallales bacterium]
MNADLYHHEDKTTLVSRETRKKIFRNVVIVHIVLITLILIWGFLVELFRPERPKVITVSLSSPPEVSGAPAAPVKPPRKPEVKTTRKKPEPAPPKPAPSPKWKPAKTIKVSREVVYVKPQVPVRQPEVISKEKLLNYLNQNRVKIRSAVASGVAQSYENSVGAYLYQQWKTPDKSVLGGKHPEVKVSLNIAADGRLLGAKILNSSGIAAMDNSVKQLLTELKYLPAPPDGARDIVLILEVIE